MQNQFASQVEIGSQYYAVVATVLLAFHLAASWGNFVCDADY